MSVSRRGIQLFFLISLTILAALLAAGPAVAQCPGEQPLVSEIVNNDPAVLAACGGLNQSGGCWEPSPPQAGSTLAQETTLTALALLPAGFTPTSVWWRAEHRLGPGNFVILWEYKSTENVPAQTGDEVSFGAPGLVESAPHHFRVSYCDADGCLCWSNRSSIATTQDFSTLPPTSPMSTSFEVEDNFRRLLTQPKVAGGDGLGPDQVWMVDPVSNTRIGDDTDSAFLAPGANANDAIALYARKEATGVHSFSEVLFRNEGLSSGGVRQEYRFDVEAKAQFVMSDVYVGSS